jgi:hypothetical protein
MKNKIKLIGFLISITVLLTVTRTVVLNSVATGGPLLAKVNAEISFYETENAVLSQEVYTKSSLNEIALKAEKMGFVNQKTGFSLSNAIPIASVR